MLSKKFELQGHLLDSRVLPGVISEVESRGGDIIVEESTIGRTKDDASRVIMEVTAPTAEAMSEILQVIRSFGGRVIQEEEVDLQPAPKNGVFPEGFYSTTNLPTQVFFAGEYRPVEDIEMDCAVVIDTKDKTRARCVPIHRIQEGERVVVGHRGVRVLALAQEKGKEVFSFMGSEVSSERPKTLVVKDIASKMQEIRGRGGKILLVLGPAVIHTGAGRHLEKLIAAGYVQCVFAGNAVATHDIEHALYGTSLGIYLDTGASARGGHAHHLRAINRIRLAGGIREAVEQGILTRGVMHAVITHGVDFVLAGSIRDDGPLPEVISDTVKAQDAMRIQIRGVEMALMLASMLHAIATGNILPATVRTVCVDINPAVVTKLVDRGSHQTMGIVSDVEWFLWELCDNLLA